MEIWKENFNFNGNESKPGLRITGSENFHSGLVSVVKGKETKLLDWFRVKLLIKPFCEPFLERQNFTLSLCCHDGDSWINNNQM